MTTMITGKEAGIDSGAYSGTISQVRKGEVRIRGRGHKHSLRMRQPERLDREAQRDSQRTGCKCSTGEEKRAKPEAQPLLARCKGRRAAGRDKPEGEQGGRGSGIAQPQASALEQPKKRILTRSERSEVQGSRATPAFGQRAPRERS